MLINTKSLNLIYPGYIDKYYQTTKLLIFFRLTNLSLRTKFSSTSHVTSQQFLLQSGGWPDVLLQNS